MYYVVCLLRSHWQMARMKMTEASEVRAHFDEVARRWRQEFKDRNNEEGERKDLASRWQQYSDRNAQEHMYQATLTKVTDPKRKRTVGNLWWNKGSPPRQATLALKRGSTDMYELHVVQQKIEIPGKGFVFLG